MLILSLSIRVYYGSQGRAELVEAQSTISRLRAELFEREEKAKSEAAEAEALKSQVLPPTPSSFQIYSSTMCRGGAHLWLVGPCQVTAQEAKTKVLGEMWETRARLEDEVSHDTAAALCCYGGEGR